MPFAWARAFNECGSHIDMGGGGSTLGHFWVDLWQSGLDVIISGARKGEF